MNQQAYDNYVNPNTISGLTYQQSASRSVVDPTSMQAYQKRPGRYRTPGVQRLLRQNTEHDEEEQGCCQRCCKTWCTCLWAIFAIIGLLTLGLIGFGYAKQHGWADKINSMVNRIRGVSPTTDLNIQQNTDLQEKTLVKDGECQPGFFVNDGQCISCPAESYWNGKHCIRKKKQANQPS